MLNLTRQMFTSLQTTALYETGLLNLGLKRYQTAIEYFTQAIERDSQYADAFYQRGVAFQELGEQQKATSDFQKAVELNPKFLDDLLGAAKTEMDSKLYLSAVKKFDQVLEINPRLDKIFIQRASAKYALGKHKEAIMDYDKAINLAPQKDAYYCDRGSAKGMLGFYEEAMADYQQALQLNPQSTHALLNRGIAIYRSGGRYHQALIDFIKILELIPQLELVPHHEELIPHHALTFYYLGLVNFELGNYENAKINFRASIRIQDGNADVYIASGIVRELIGPNPKAVTKAFRYARKLTEPHIEHDPSNVEAWIKLFTICSCNHEYGDNRVHWDKIIKGFESCIKSASLRTPTLAALCHYYLARAYQINCEFGKAEESFLQSMKLEENSRVNYEYANFLIQQKKMTLAISKLQRALELSADGECIAYYTLFSPLLNQELQNELGQAPRLNIRVSVLAAWRLIKCYIEIGEKNRAEQQLNNLLRAVEDFPSPIAYSLLGYACQALEQWHLAARSFKTTFLLRANYFLAQQNLQKCLEQLSVQENDIEPFAIIDQIPQSLISPQSLALVKHGPKDAHLILSKTISQRTGLKYEEIPGNGHCLFTAVGLYLGEDQNFLRCIVASHIKHHLNQFAEYLALPPGKTIEDYLQDVRSGEEWADHIEIEVLMRVLNRPIMVIDSNGRLRNPEDVNREGEPIFVYYNGRDHYDALLLPEGVIGKDILRTITKHSDKMVDLQEPLTELSEHPHVSQSTNPSVLSDKQQEPTKKPLTERSKLNFTQHKNYQSVSNTTSLPKVNPIKEINSSYQEFYLLTDSHKSGEKLLKMPMEEFVGNQDQKSSETKSESALPGTSNTPSISNVQNDEEKKAESIDYGKLLGHRG